MFSTTDYRDYRYYSEDDIKSRHKPRNIADYEPGKSSISEREKQMVSLFCLLRILLDKY